MKTKSMRIPRIIICCAWSLLAAGLTVIATATDTASSALMVVAHGSHDAGWNQRVMATVEKLDWAGPKAVAFLTSPSPEHEMKQVATQLDQPGVKQIVVVPLLVSSFSGHYEEIQYYTGQRKDLPHEPGTGADHGEAAPLHTKAPLLLTTAMDGHPLISRILGDELKPFVKDAGAQTVVLVAHGPNEDSENELWLGHLRAHAARLKEQFGFRAVEVATLRDDAPKQVREAATRKLRASVESAAKDSQVLILPVLISVGHVQNEIQRRLAGLECTMIEGGLANHALAAEWVRAQATEKSAAGPRAALTASNRK